MLRIHFTDGDLARTRLATEPDPMWETVLSLHRLRARPHDTPTFSTWRRQARQTIGARAVRRQLGLLCSIVPVRGYFPDFLTPAQPTSSLSAGLDALHATPRARLRHDIAHGARERVLPAWTRSLAAGDADAIDLLSSAISDVYDAVIRTSWALLENDIDADRDRSAKAILNGGLTGLFESFTWASHWDGRTLSMQYPYDLDIHLGGRGLRLIPSYFCWDRPVALADPHLPPVLVYSIRDRSRWAPHAVQARRQEALADLLGRTRARVLETVTHGPLTTTELAQRAGVAPSSASEHLAVLRAAGLVESRRKANAVLHSLTTTGEALVSGEGC